MENKKGNDNSKHQEKKLRRESKKNLPIFKEDDFESTDSKKDDQKDANEDDIQNFKLNENVCSSSDCSD